jgi:hypothetical protein
MDNGKLIMCQSLNIRLHNLHCRPNRLFEKSAIVLCGEKTLMMCTYANRTTSNHSKIEHFNNTAIATALCDVEALGMCIPLKLDNKQQFNNIAIATALCDAGALGMCIPPKRDNNSTIPLIHLHHQYKLLQHFQLLALAKGWHFAARV